MNHKAGTTEDESPKNQIETIGISADATVSAIEWNARNRYEQRSHVLRVSPPFASRVQASIHILEDGTHYPPEMNPKPIHLDPDQFHDAEFGYPEQWEVQEAAKEVDNVDDISEVSDETVEECWEVHCEVWESEVRASLKDEIDLNEYGHGDSHVVTVKYEG